MKKNKKIVFIITCFVFVMSYSSLLGTASFNRQLNILVNENDLSYEDIRQLITEVNQIESIKYNKYLKKELKRIEKRKEKEKKAKENKYFFSISRDRHKISKFYLFFCEKKINKEKTEESFSIKTLKNSENNLKLIE
ncbi:hypothetical protein [Leptotrichia sp. OH3620_COT-345]|uniref:hypothetical protein n=1 Tax=Leptotrichia sp. OH3620_COT-345 TaxID=2491048 RepID=UPI001315A2FD|nr:hypothetical protein [Leptotrichia sp. OH3620_COT-345]